MSQLGMRTAMIACVASRRGRRPRRRSDRALSIAIAQNLRLSAKAPVTMPAEARKPASSAPVTPLSAAARRQPSTFAAFAYGWA